MTTEGATTEGAQSVKPRIWQIPPWQVAVLFLGTTGLAAITMYSSSSPPARGIAAVFGLMMCASAVYSMRMLLYADDDGVAVRRFARTTFVPWSEVRSIDVVDLKHGQSTIRVTCRDGRTLDVPPTLLLPTLPTKAARALGALGAVAAELRAIKASSTR
jgi:hypothetical protein